MSLLSNIRQLAQIRSHGPLRKFTDQILIQCVLDGLTASEAASKLGACKSTIRHHADRLNLRFDHRSHCLSFSKDDDELIRACARGEVMLSYVSRALGNVSFSSIRYRAKRMGIVIPVKRQPRKNFDPKVYAARDYDIGNPITVGKDRLLHKLKDIHGQPRDEVYPGSVKAA